MPSVRGEYLLFDLLVGLPALALALYDPAVLAGRWRRLLGSIVAVGVPFVAWDAWVVGRHWWFNDAYVLGPSWLGLPVEEWLFFLVVPFACVFTWRSVFLEKGEPRERPALRILYAPLLAGAPLGALLFLLGREYTGLALIALAAAAAWDRGGARLLTEPRFLAYLGAVAGFTLLFNGYLTARPVVLYGVAYQLDFRVVTIPIEDFVYGLALVFAVTTGFEGGLRRSPLHRAVARLVERRLGGYRQRIDAEDPSLPRELAQPRRVAVLGAGLAGLTAATTLAERRFAVTLFEANPYLGGKIGAWSTTLPGGERMGVEHGFHAFFRHYYNLERWLEGLGAAQRLVPIEDYLILSRDGRSYGFAGLDDTPLLNLVSLATHGIYRIRDVALGPAGREMEAFLRYDPERTPAEFDSLSFAAFSERARLPPSLQLVFHTFARAFFADADKLSMGELIKSFHSFYLCHDHGLIYRYPDGDYAETILAPVRRRLEKHGADVRLESPVSRIERDGGGFRVAGERFDHVVVATPAAAARDLLLASDFVASEAPELARALPGLRCGQRYAMLRLWLDRDCREDVPVFVITEKRRVLDSVSVYHRIERESAEWAAREGGGIFELHCYAVPDELATEDVREAFLEELPYYFPELARAAVRHEVLQVRDDFTAFHVGMAASRPRTETGVEGLVLAGDWVRLPCPAMLMEAACTSGLLAANAILRGHGLREEPVETVPLRGLLA